MEEKKMNKQVIFVIGEVRNRRVHSVSLELTGKARDLGRKIDAEIWTLFLYSEDPQDLDKVFDCGAHAVILVENEKLETFHQEIFSKVISEMIRLYSPEIVLAPATTSGRTYMPAVAAMVNTGLTADCTGLDIEEDTGLLLQTRPAIGGNIMATIKTPERKPQMATVRPRTFRIPDPVKKENHQIIRPELESHLFDTRIENLELVTQDSDDIDIQDMDVIVAGGKGLKRAENFELLHDLAEILGGGIGASRPTVDAKWVEYPHQVGLSGKVVSPKLYIAGGISGAVQHLAGMQTAETIIAINKDPEAPIFKVADIALCGDIFEILPKLVQKLRKEGTCRGNK
jgi:electron transfer flavoprotein alpha subunit